MNCIIIIRTDDIVITGVVSQPIRVFLQHYFFHPKKLNNIIIFKKRILYELM